MKLALWLSYINLNSDTQYKYCNAIDLHPDICKLVCDHNVTKKINKIKKTLP